MLLFSVWALLALISSPGKAVCQSFFSHACQDTGGWPMRKRIGSPEWGNTLVFTHLDPQERFLLFESLGHRI